MVLNAAVQMLREAEEIKQNILKFKSDTSMLQEQALWTFQQQLQKIYQKVLVLDLDYALDKKVEQDLWNVGFKQQIEALQAISRDRKNPLRSEGQAMLSWVLQAATGFYLSLLHQICTTFKLDLPFRRRASLLGWVEGWGCSGPVDARLPPPAAARYICQHCLVHLGDLARYRHQPRVAYSFYRHALVVSTHSGQPYNQLALLEWRRGRRLGALYWHVRSLMVRAPFPPAPNNLARTLAAHCSSAARDLPVVPGLRRAAAAPPPAAAAAAAAAARLDSHAYIAELMRAMHLIHTLDHLDYAAALVETLNNSLTTLVATDSFDSMTLIKMICVIIWLVHSTTEDLTINENALSSNESTAATLSQTLAWGALLALLLPSYTTEKGPKRALPALKVFLQWTLIKPQVLECGALASRPQIWHALAHTLNKLKPVDCAKYDTVPLAEDEELHGFLPLEESFQELRFTNHAAWDTYGRRVPDVDATADDIDPPSVVTGGCLEPALQEAVRARRLVLLGRRLADLSSDHLSCTVDEDDNATFVATCRGGEQLSQAVAELAAATEAAEPCEQSDSERSEGDVPLPPPVVISEADFREKVREKRVGILKPQGSLERAREERALATNQEDQDFEEFEEGKEERRESRKPRVNIAMAAIMRKQEENNNKQVKFLTPPATAEEQEGEPEQEVDVVGVEPRPRDRPRPAAAPAKTQPPRKTGGILALKDKSGYPHLVNVEPEPRKQKDDRKDAKTPHHPQTVAHGSQTYPPPPQWHHPERAFDEPPRPPGQFAPNKNYGLQGSGIGFNPKYHQPTATVTDIRLPVVNPREIDVRSAALQKQTARGVYPPPATRHVNKKGYEVPPRFRNEPWEAAEGAKNQYRDEELRRQLAAGAFAAPPAQWMPAMAGRSSPPPPPPPAMPSLLDSFSQQPPYQSLFNARHYPYTAGLQLQQPYNTNGNPFQNVSYNPLAMRSEALPPFMQPIGPQVQTESPMDFSSLGRFASYSGPLDLSSGANPQYGFGRAMPPGPPGPPAAPELQLPDLELRRRLGLENPEPTALDLSVAKDRQEPAAASHGEPASYSLFSEPPGASAVGAPSHQSLWTGPGPSPLERLFRE